MVSAVKQFAGGVGHEVQFVVEFSVPVPCPEQHNRVDCGMFTVGFAAAIMLGVNINNIVQSKMPHYRHTWAQQVRRAGQSGSCEVFTRKLLGV